MSNVLFMLYAKGKRRSWHQKSVFGLRLLFAIPMRCFVLRTVEWSFERHSARGRASCATQPVGGINPSYSTAKVS